jgi:two-component system LytT family sensor kinase
MVGLLFAVRRIVLAKVEGTHIRWVIESALELVWWYVWAAYTPLVMGLAKRFPLTGPRFVPHIAIHTITSLMMAPLASVTDYFLSRGLLQSAFRITGPGVLQFLSPFGVSVLFMSFTGMLTYWLIVGLYQSIHFYQAAMERQTIAAQLETQLSHAELENLKSQLHPHFLFNSLHTIGILMQENVDAASHLLVCLGDLLRMALERRENEITLQSELEFVGKYLEIEQTRFHDRLKVHMDVKSMYRVSRFSHWLRMPSSTASASILPQAGWRSLLNSITAEFGSASAMTARVRHRDRACDSALDSPMCSHA